MFGPQFAVRVILSTYPADDQDSNRCQSPPFRPKRNRLAFGSPEGEAIRVLGLDTWTPGYDREVGLLWKLAEIGRLVHQHLSWGRLLLAVSMGVGGSYGSSPGVCKWPL